MAWDDYLSILDDEMAVTDDDVDVGQIIQIRVRFPIDDDDIGQFARLEGPQLVIHV